MTIKIKRNLNKNINNKSNEDYLVIVSETVKISITFSKSIFKNLVDIIVIIITIIIIISIIIIIILLYL